MVERGQGGQQWLMWLKMLDQEEYGGFEFVCCLYSSCVDPIGVCDVRSCAFAKQLYLGGCWTSHDSVSFGTGCKWHRCYQRQTHQKECHTAELCNDGILVVATACVDWCAVWLTPGADTCCLTVPLAPCDDLPLLPTRLLLFSVSPSELSPCSSSRGTRTHRHHQPLHLICQRSYLHISWKK